MSKAYKRDTLSRFIPVTGDRLPVESRLPQYDGTRRAMTEGEAANGIYFCLLTTLKDSKDNGLLNNADWISGNEKWLATCGLELLLLYAAKPKHRTKSPSIPLPWPKGCNWRLDASTCPPGFRPCFHRWASIVSDLQALPQYLARDLELLICRKPSITTSKSILDLFPFFVVIKQHERRKIRGLLSELLNIANALSARASLASLWRGRLWTALSEENSPNLSNWTPNLITSSMTIHDVILVLGQHHCPIVSHELDLASCSARPIYGGRLHNVYKGRLLDGTLVAVRTQSTGTSYFEVGERDFMSRAARELYTWSKCRHPNVQPLIGAAQFNNQIATISPWAENGHIREYVNKQPGVDRFNLCTQVASGLAYLHSAKIIHGSLKGSKVLISNLGVPILSGFVNSVDHGSTLLFPEIYTDKIDLSPRWAAPELFSDDEVLSMAADTILEIFTGELPYSDIKSDFTLIRAVNVHKRPPVRPLKQFPLNDTQGDMLWTLLAKCWQYEPDQRPTAEQAYKHMKPFVIDSTMVASEIIAHLGSRNCPNLSDQLELGSCSQYPLSNGGCGEVYQGALKSGELVALKSMIVTIGSSRSEQELLKDTAQELYTWSKCNHANVVKLLGLAIFRDRIAMVSPWMNNGSLTSYVQRNADADRCQLCAQVAEGLTYLHRIPMIHGDVKAANVLVSDQGVAMITDFGNSILNLSTLRFSGMESGCKVSVRWTAPELFSEGAKHSRQADVYALGMVILETLTGEVPFPKKRSDAMVIHAVMNLKEKPSRPECIPSKSVDADKLWLLLIDCWSHEPTERPKAAEVRDMMNNITMGGLSPLT